jgi:ABC-type polysaccharide/polyol phosphate transport system ATPase subunit
MTLDRVTVDFPIYGAHPTLRGLLTLPRTGGGVRRAKHRVIVRALDGVSLSIWHGDRIGLLGHNGAGKSTLLKVLAGVYEPTSGTIEIRGRISPLFNVAPGLDMDDTGRENIRSCGLWLGMSDREIAAKEPEIIAFTELGEFIDFPVRTYSAGMIARLGFALATAIDPEILLLDEGLGAGDARFIERATRRVDDLVRRSSIMVLASHSEGLLRSMCNKAVLMEHGRIVRDGSVDDVLAAYRQHSEAA